MLNLNFVVWLPLFVICMLCFQSLFTEALPVCLFVRWSVCVLSVFGCWPVCVLSVNLCVGLLLLLTKEVNFSELI